MRTLVSAIVFTLIFGAWGATYVINNYFFNINCQGYIKRAADANTVEMAKKELSKAIDYAKENNLTQGFTSILFKDPAEDVGFWYSNMVATYKELEAIPEDTTQLEKTNVLMKLRESLTDHGGDGNTKVTVPKGISIFPHNMLFFWWGMLSGIGACALWMLWYLNNAN